MANLQKEFETAQAGMNFEIQKGVQMMEEALETLDFSLMKEGAHHVGLHGGRSVSQHVRDAKKQFIQKLTEALEEDGFEVNKGDRTITFLLNNIRVLKLTDDDLCAIDLLRNASSPLPPFEKRLKEVQQIRNDRNVQAEMTEKMLKNPTYVLTPDYLADADKISGEWKPPFQLRLMTTALIAFRPKSKKKVERLMNQARYEYDSLKETHENLLEKEQEIRLQEENFPYVKEEAPKLLKKYNFGVMQ